MKTLLRFDQCAGKTIEKIVNPEFSNYPLAVHFKDGTALLIEAELGYDHDWTLSSVSDPEDHHALYCGLISQEEHDKRQQAWRERWASQQAAQERAQYEKLKAKFEGIT